MDKQSFQKLVKSHTTYTSILKAFGYSGRGGSGLTLRQRIKEEDIDCSHIQKNNKGKKFINRELIPLEEVMVENSTYCRSSLKRRLLKNGMLENKCEICGLDPLWENKKLVLVLDHINGVNDDHRRENLRILCPNCNSQTPTFAGRTLRKKYNCVICGKKTTKKRKYCDDCLEEVQREFSISQRRVERPSKEQLLKMIEETNYCAVGRKYGVSDNAIRKWLK